MVTDEVDLVVGVDTHADQHALAVVEAASRRTCRQLKVVATRQGYRRALRRARRHAPGRRVWALEGSGCYGAGVAGFLASHGERELEVERPTREGRGGRLNSDALDAERAARQVLAGSAGALPRLAAKTQALRALLATREGAVRARRPALNELRAIIVTVRPSCANDRTPQPTRYRPDLGGSSPDRTVHTRPDPLRSSVRPTRRYSTDPGQLRQDHPPPPRPRRRRPAQPGAPHDRPCPPPNRPRHPGLHHPPRRRRTKQARSDPQPQALPHPLPRRTTGGDTTNLTLIEASPVLRRR
jgi:hypothetical protein